MTEPQIGQLITGEQYTELTGDEPPSALTLAAASSAITEYCGWHIYPITELTHSIWAPAVTLPCLRVVSIATVTVDGDVFALGEDEWSEAGVLRPRYGWPWGAWRITITYEGGYLEVPPVLVALAKGLIERDVVPSGIAQRTTGQRTITYARATDGAGFTDTERMILNRYRVRSGP